MIVVFGFVYVLCNSFINITLRQWWSSFELPAVFKLLNFFLVNVNTPVTVDPGMKALLSKR